MQRHRSLSDREAFRQLFPKGDPDRSLCKLTVYLLLIVFSVVALLYFKELTQEPKEQHWDSATATILEARPKLVGQQSRAMLYQVEILASYSIGGVAQARWIAVSRLPMPLEEAEFDATRWKGSKCTVHWKQSEPSKVIAELG